MPPNCGGRYPWSKGCREYFSADVVAAVDIGMDGSAPFDAIPAAISIAGEVRLLFLVGSLARIVGRQHIEIPKTGFARITFFRDHHPHPNRLRLRGEQLQHGCLPRTSVPIRSATSNAILRRRAVCR